MTTPTPPTDLPYLADRESFTRDEVLAFARVAVAADRASASRATPEGWVLVPREPTLEMRLCGEEWVSNAYLVRKAWDAMIAAATPAGALTVLQPSVAVSEPMYLVMAGGDGFQSSIVPASRLDDAYLLTQWIDLECVKPDDRAEALEHFHDDDNWTHTDVTGNGERLEFSVSFEGGWVRVIRLFDTSPLTANQAAEAPPVAVEATKAVAPLTDLQIADCATDIDPYPLELVCVPCAQLVSFVRNIERAHGILATPATPPLAGLEIDEKGAK